MSGVQILLMIIFNWFIKEPYNFNESVEFVLFFIVKHDNTK